jgi:hypothetical protein
MNFKMQNKFSRMTRWLAALILATNSFALAQSTNDLATTDFSAFQIIPQRNIFNPNRYPIRSGYRPQPRLRAGVPTFSLAGTMSYRKGMFAFFSGNNSDYEKALQVGGTIAGYTVTKIGWESVEMKFGGTNTVEMKVGAVMQLQGGDWQLAEPGELSQPVAPVTPANETQTQTDNSSAGETPPPANVNAAGNDTLKKLMQQRQQEESK